MAGLPTAKSPGGKGGGDFHWTGCVVPEARRPEWLLVSMALLALLSFPLTTYTPATCRSPLSLGFAPPSCLLSPSPGCPIQPAHTAHSDLDLSSFLPPICYSSCDVHKAGKMWFVSLASTSLYSGKSPRVSLGSTSSPLNLCGLFGSSKAHAWISSKSINTTIVIGSGVSM